MKIIKGTRQKKQRSGERGAENDQSETNSPLSGKLEDWVAFAEQKLGNSADLVVRRFRMFGRIPATMHFFSSMADQTIVSSSILKPLMQSDAFSDKAAEPDVDEVIDFALQEKLYYGDVSEKSGMGSLIDSILAGYAVISVEGARKAIIVGVRNVDKRSIEQPATEQVIRGPREGLIEELGTNLGLLRYRLQSPDFRVATQEIGRRTRSTVAVCYLEGVADPVLLDELDKRLSKIDIDGVLDSGYLEQYIEDNHWSPFPQVQYTERPDKIAANLMEGKIAILVNGSPLALIVPSVLSQFYQTVEDYTERFLLMSAIRLARFVALIFSLVFPSIYVAIISFNPELIPTDFAVAVAGGRAGVPFPAVIEVLIMEISMEVLREATIRLPQQVGGALSIVGVLVIGQAAVAAGFASPITVVIIALTTIGSFATPAYNVALALRLLRFPLIIMAGIFGLYGIMIGLILITNHLLSLKSFGVPYMTPMIPGDVQGMKDFLLRSPWQWMTNRPSFLHPQDKVRISKQSGGRLRQRSADDPASHDDS